MLQVKRETDFDKKKRHKFDMIPFKEIINWKILCGFQNQSEDKIDISVVKNGKTSLNFFASILSSESQSFFQLILFFKWYHSKFV